MAVRRPHRHVADHAAVTAVTARRAPPVITHLQGRCPSRRTREPSWRAKRSVRWPFQKEIRGPRTTLAVVQTTPWGLPADDLSSSTDASEDDLARWRGARILVTGGTGFVGSWLTSSLLHADRRLALDLDLVLLSRYPDRVPVDETPRLSIISGDVRRLPDVGSVDVIVHGAASSSAPFGLGDGDPRNMAATIVDGTQAVLEAGARTKARILFLSSGAIYGPRTEPVAEADVTGGPDPLDPRAAYGNAKRLAETLCAAATGDGAVEAVVARLFTFIGPRLPTDRHYAAGNFLDDARRGRTISVLGDGRSRRSYLYAGDLPEWCWAVMSRGATGAAYNVGSPDALAIADLAHRIAALADKRVDVEILGTPDEHPPACYVPVTTRADQELALRPRTDLDTAIRKSLAWLSGAP